MEVELTPLEVKIFNFTRSPSLASRRALAYFFTIKLSNKTYSQVMDKVKEKDNNEFPIIYLIDVSKLHLIPQKV